MVYSNRLERLKNTLKRCENSLCRSVTQIVHLISLDFAHTLSTRFTLNSLVIASFYSIVLFKLHIQELFLFGMLLISTILFYFIILRCNHEMYLFWYWISSCFFLLISVYIGNRYMWANGFNLSTLNDFTVFYTLCLNFLQNP